MAGSRLRPPVPSPPALRPYLRFQKLPTAALGPVRRTVETDDAFRERVAAVVEEELAGRVGWLWLHRPDGWAGEAASLIEAAEADEAAASQARDERVAAKRLDAAEAATRRVAGEVAAVRAELSSEHDRRVEAEGKLHRTERRLTQLDVELGGARRRLVQAEDELAAARAREANAEARAGDAEARVAVVEALLAEAEARARVADAALDLARRGTEAPAVPGVVLVSPTPVAPATVTDVPGLVAALRDAAEATQRLGTALAAAATAVGADTEPDVCPPDAGVMAPPVAARRRRVRRTPLPLPGGMYADTIQAATHLVRQPGVLLVVDGYNAAKLGWPDDVLPVQRERLLDAMEELIARHGTAVHVVFDGADVTPGAPGRRQMRVEFSPPGVSADEVIVELVGSVPTDRPIVVATNDGEVREGSRAGGANVISSQQLLAVARR